MDQAPQKDLSYIGLTSEIEQRVGCVCAGVCADFSFDSVLPTKSKMDLNHYFEKMIQRSLHGHGKYRRAPCRIREFDEALAEPTLDLKKVRRICFGGKFEHKKPTQTSIEKSF